jgi:curved DNA-binding protein CbpA
MAPDRDVYTVLHLLPDAPQEVIVAAYRALARRYHPDGQSPQLNRMKELNLAYERVRTPQRRAAYDAERRRRLVPVGPGRPGANGHAGQASHSAATPATAAASATRAGATTAGGVRPPFGFRSGSAAADDSELLDFGQYAGWRISQIARHDPDYLRWLSRHSSGLRFLEEIRRALPGETDLGRG